MSEKVMNILAEKFIEAIEVGTAPWRKPWKGGGPNMNPVTGTVYKGFNFWSTFVSSMIDGYRSNLWLTFNQVKTMGGKVITGQSGTPITYVAFKENEDGYSEFAGIRYYTIFNVEQTEGLSFGQSDSDVSVSKVDDAEAIIENWSDKPKIRPGSSAYYAPSLDTISIPNIGDFASVAEYYNTLFHEMVHATGHKERLNRPGVVENTGFGNYNYGIEELIAELGAARLMHRTSLGMPTFDNSASYLDGWLKKIKEQPSIIYQACQKAEKAVNYIIPVEEESMKEAV